MIFASDLDRTLIYSKKSMGEDITEEDLVPVEIYNDRYISYMSKQALSLLHEITRLSTFIPVTTRTVKQYQRIFHLADSFSPKYVITSNGGNILIDNIPDLEWSELVGKVLRTSESHQNIKALFDEITSPEWVLRGGLCDDLFYTIMIDRDKMPAPVMDRFREKLHTLGWTLSIQGRKLYILPTQINKGDALRYLKERIGASCVVAAGDSLLDESMLLVADYSYAPSHGELFSTYLDSEHYKFTEGSGIRASEEILARAIEDIKGRVGESYVTTHLV